MCFENLWTNKLYMYRRMLLSTSSALKVEPSGVSDKLVDIYICEGSISADRKLIKIVAYPKADIYFLHTYRNIF
jgi:hypothetical protein